jgi:large subunit ribosomal protein L24
MAIRIRKDDVVEVIAGEHKGERGKVLKVIPKEDKVLIQGVNMVYRHVRPSRKSPQGGRLQKEAPMHISNVLPIDDKAGRGKRVRFEVEMGADGRRKAKYRATVAGTRLNEVTQEKAEG